MEPNTATITLTSAHRLSGSAPMNVTLRPNQAVSTHTCVKANANAMPLLLEQQPEACAALVRRGCGADADFRDAPLMMGLTVGANNTLPQVDQDVAAFLLLRADYAYIGWGVWGMTWVSSLW